MKLFRANSKLQGLALGQKQKSVSSLHTIQRRGPGFCSALCSEYGVLSSSKNIEMH